MGDIILMDGGTSLELINRSANKTPRHWSCEYLMHEPDLVRDVHLDYIKAGAKVITTNAYSATFTRMRMVDAEDKVPEFQERACRLAIEARSKAGGLGADVAIAGCIPPLNGTYRPDRVRPFEVNLEEYKKLCRLQAPHVDLFLCETMSTADEARAAVAAACEFGKPVWVGWSLVDDGRSLLRSGETIRTAYEAVRVYKVSAVLANCTTPESVTAAIPELVATGVPAGGYANAFTNIPSTFLPGKTKEQLSTRRDLGPEAYAVFAMRWAKGGAAIVGGCCEVGPSHIARLRDELIAQGFRIMGPKERLHASGGSAPR